MPKFAANLSMLFNELEFMDRFAAASKVGFTGVEYLFPYGYPLAELCARLTQSGLTQVLHNLPPGDWQAGERGIACLPDRRDEFRQSVELGLQYATGLCCQQVNCLAGIRPVNVDEVHAWDTLLENLDYAAQQFAAHELTLTIEAINSRVDMPGFLIDNSAKAMQVIETLNRPNLKFQYDLYHMQIMEGNLISTIEDLLPSIGHIQFADNPGRHQPGTGEINFDFVFAQLDRMGYSGWVSAEYRPLGGTETSLGWL